MVSLVLDGVKRTNAEGEKKEDIGPVRVVIESDLPPQLTSVMVQCIETQWRRAMEASKGDRWLLEKMFAWVEARYVPLIQLAPACLEEYFIESASGLSQRRFMVVFPKQDEEDELSEDEKERRAEEEKERKAAAARFWAEKAERDQLKALEAAEAEAEEKRRLHESGEALPRAKVISQKERDAAYKEKHDKQGKRMAKAGPRRRKFEGE
jgi:hypothetical protein